MKISSTKGQESCTDVRPAVTYEGDRISIELTCSHGTILSIIMDPLECLKLAATLAEAFKDSMGPEIDEEDE